MKLVLQRVSRSSVTVDQKEIARIGRGLMILCGAEKGDDDASVRWLAEKSTHLRIFPDDSGKMNLSLKDIEGEALVVSQFTLAGDCSKGRRPGFDHAALPDEARRLYELYIAELKKQGIPVQTGQFAADMKVDLLNDGPVTFILQK